MLEIPKKIIPLVFIDQGNAADIATNIQKECTNQQILLERVNNETIRQSTAANAGSIKKLWYGKSNELKNYNF